MWFKVDDHFHAHPKVAEVGLAALGLWVKAGSWCGNRGSDGMISMAVVRSLGGTPRLCAELCTANLWEQVGDLYRFVNWENWNPTSTQRTVKKQAAAERMARLRGMRKGQCSREQDDLFARSSPDVRSTPNPNPNPSSVANATARGPEAALVTDGVDLSPDKLRRASQQKPLSETTPTHQFRVWWENKYRDKYGVSYLWGKTDGALSKEMISGAGLDETKRRAEILLTDAPRWIQAGGSADIRCLRANFNKLAREASVEAALGSQDASRNALDRALDVAMGRVDSEVDR